MRPHPASQIFPLMVGRQFDELVADIREKGLRMAIVLCDGQVLDGRNRLRACRDVGIEPRFETYNGHDPMAYVISTNLHRRHLSESQRGDIAATLATAKQGQKVPIGTFTLKEAAKVMNVSRRTAARARAVQAAAPELAQNVRSGKTTLNAAHRQVQRQKAIAKIEAEAQPLPVGPFRVLVADPPWAYTKRKDDGTHRAALTYPSMTTDEICAMPVCELGFGDSVLWLWTTNAFMRDAFRVLDAWGYTEKTILTWAKNKMGTGDWLRGKTEHCILAIRGRPTVNLTNQTTLLNGKVRQHSRKPEEFYALVERLCPGSKCELFAREHRDGWQIWGAENEKFDKA